MHETACGDPGHSPQDSLIRNDEKHRNQRPRAAARSNMTTAVANPSETNTGMVTDDRAGKYLAFRLGKEDFAIQVLKVREIVGIQDITSVPQMPAYVKGVINLRGKVIPVVDLRLKFGLPEKEYTQRTCIIVVQVHHARVPIQTGII